MLKLYLKIKMCGLLINIHDVTVLCGVSEHILSVQIDGIICDAVTLDENFKPRYRDRSHFVYYKVNFQT